MRAEQCDENTWVLSEEGEEIAAQGAHEVIVFNHVPSGSEGIEQAALAVRELPACCRWDVLG